MKVYAYMLEGEIAGSFLHPHLREDISTIKVGFAAVLLHESQFLSVSDIVTPAMRSDSRLCRVTPFIRIAYLLLQDQEDIKKR